jgi:large subunit ribosomal protein L9
MKYHVLLLEDVTNHGRKGELAYVAPGFARNYLLPHAKAILATYATVKTQEKLKKERDAQAIIDRKESDKTAALIKEKSFSTIVKVDNDGHMYGSVTVKDIVEFLFNEGVKIEKKHVLLPMPIKTLGTHAVNLRLPEEVLATVSIEIKPDKIIEKKKKAPKVEAVSEEEAAATEESKEDASE